MMSVTPQPCLIFSIRLTALLPSLSLTVPMMDRQPVISLRHVLARSLRSLFHRPRRRLKAHNQHWSRRFATATSRKSRPGAGWLGRNPPAITNAAGSRPRWAGGKPSSGRNSRRGTSTIRRQKQRLASVLSTGCQNSDVQSSAAWPEKSKG